jgi:hypothetical protein
MMTKSGVLPNGLGYRFSRTTLYLDKVRLFGRDYQMSVVRRTVWDARPIMLLMLLEDENPDFDQITYYDRARDLFIDDIREVANIADMWDDRAKGGTS